MVVAALGLDPDPGLGVVLPALGRTDPPGTPAGGGVAVAGLGTSGLSHRDRAVVVTGDGQGCVAAVVATADLDVRAVHGIDPLLGLVAVAVDGVAVPEAADRAPVPWAAAVAAGQRALAHELVGASRRMLDLAREHAVERVQFGRPIAAFQAVRHRLAESFVAIEAADAALAPPPGTTTRRWPPRWPRRSPGAAPAPWPATASRCWPASGSPPSTTCTATSAGSWCSTACSATAARSPGSSARTCSTGGRCPRCRPCDEESLMDLGLPLTHERRGTP